VEELQLETAKRLENAIAIFSFVTLIKIYLEYQQARIKPEVYAKAAFTDDEIEALKLKFKDKLKNIYKLTLTIQQSEILIIFIGSFIARKGGVMHEVKTLWRESLALNIHLRA